MDPLTPKELDCIQGCLTVVRNWYPDRAIRAEANDILTQIRGEHGIEGLSAGRLGRVCLALGLAREAVLGERRLPPAERMQTTDDINCLVAKLRRRLPDRHKAVLDDEDVD
jgi:hypothetical protein